MATFDYDQLGRRERLTLGNDAVTRYEYDPVSRLSKLTHDLNGALTGNDNEISFTYNSASQIVSRTATNTAYAWTGHGNGSASYVTDGLNRLISQATGAASTGFSHDARSNRLNDGFTTYFYDSENKARGVAAAPFQYDPLGRLSGIGSPLILGYENYIDRIVAERRPGGAGVERRHVFGPGTDEPLVWYEGSSRRFLQADERGSIVAVSDGSGAVQNVNRYDEYGRTQNSNNWWLSRFGYTGQRWFGGFDIHHYKNRVYDQGRGRFMQPDPIGYGGGMNVYAYVGGDPVNWTDPMGLAPGDCANNTCEPFSITARRGGAAGFGLGSGGRFQLDEPIEAAGGGGGPVGSQPQGPDARQPRCLANPPSIPRSAETTSRAVNQALREAYGRGSGPMSSPLTREFARLDAIPDFSRGGWQQSTSGHAGYAWELPIPSMAGYVVKVYINDRDLGGRNTVAITSSTYSAGHVIEYGINFSTGYVGNAERAVEYLRSKQPCR